MGAWQDQYMTMPLLNVVCFGGGRYKKRYLDRTLLHRWVRSELPDEGGSGRITETGRFRLDEWFPEPQQGMFARESLVTYVPAHGDWLPDGTEDWTSCLGGAGGIKPRAFDEFGCIGGSAVVLDACHVASDDWLYDHRGRLRPECRSLAGKPLLGGSGKSKPRGHQNILVDLLDVLAALDDTAMSHDKLLCLLKEVLERAAMKSPDIGLQKAYAVRTVTSTPSEVWQLKKS